MKKIRFEKTYNGVKTVLEGPELGTLIDALTELDLDGLKKPFKDDEAGFIAVWALEAYKKVYPDSGIDVTNWEERATDDARKADLFYKVMVYMLGRLYNVDRKWQALFDCKPIIEWEKKPGLPERIPGTWLTRIDKLDIETWNAVAAKDLVKRAKINLPPMPPVPGQKDKSIKDAIMN